MKKIFLISLVFILLSTSKVLAVDCFTTFSGDQTVSESCTLVTYDDGNDGNNRTVSGIDAGTESTNTATLTVSNGILTINGTETLVVGDMELTGGSVFIDEGAIVEIGKAMWMIDEDVDGYPLSTTIYVQASAPTNGVRLNTVANMTTQDCDDSDDQTGGGTLSTWYQDSDSDTYGNPSVSIEACSQPAGYVADNTDCYDSNANAYPGQTTCYTTDRGDGSFDYNCDSSDSICTSCNLSCSSGSSTYFKDCCGTDPSKYCCNANTATPKTGVGTAGCGVAGKKPGNSKKFTCTNSPCTLSNPKNIDCNNCTPTCR